MALKSYVLKCDVNAPYVVNTGHAARPTQVKFKKFLKGRQVNGELKHSNNKPAFILVQGVLVIPVAYVKEVFSKEIVSTADGKNMVVNKTIKATADEVKESPKLKVVDASVIGAIIGIASVFLAEKQNIITEPDKKNKLYGAAIGAVLFGYIAFRMKKKK